uniref:Uncharacterized protein n=1 Tax=Tanacetum cinerariifolium TaxID=118510 RepID=A0A699HD66_TANCI|nr:hypothetical protein [Tanacetum cinerariifolium]
MMKLRQASCGKRLARKGLSLDTPYEYNLKAAKAWPGTSTFEWIPAPNYIPKESSSSSKGYVIPRLLDKKPDMKKFKSVNHIVYADAETKAKKKKMLQETRAKNAKKYKEYQATLGPVASVFTF